jgi:hypothetical protein
VRLALLLALVFDLVGRERVIWRLLGPHADALHVHAPDFLHDGVGDHDAEQAVLAALEDWPVGGSLVGVSFTAPSSGDIDRAAARRIDSGHSPKTTHELLVALRRALGG